MGANGLSTRGPSRRRRLILKHTLISLSIVVVTVAALFLARDRPQSYKPGEQIEGITSELARKIPPGYQPVRFTDVTRAAGIDFNHFHGVRSTQLPEDMGSGAAWADYDGDGWLDLYLCDIAAPLTATPDQVAASPGGNRLYRNRGNGAFEDVTEKSGVGFKGVGMGAAWADYDNDGGLDLIVTSYDRLILYHNRGDGTFEDVTRPARLDKFRGFWAGASWGDFDRDGQADLYICGYVRYAFKPEFVGSASRQFMSTVPFMLNPSSYEPEPNLLLRNNGDGTFTDVARQAGVDNPTGRSLSAAWADFDGDGWPDLYVANDISDNVMYRNLGNGRFRDISHAAWVADYRGAMGLAVGDWDGDLDADIFVTHWMAQENALYSNLLVTPGSAPLAAVAARQSAVVPVSAPSQTARKRGGMESRPPVRFQDVADLNGLGQIALAYIGWGTSFFDFDNDTRPDLLTVNGSTFQGETDKTRLVPMKNLLFWNAGAMEGFFEVGEVSGEVFRQEHVGRGAAFADYDNDGNLDVVIMNHGGAPLLLRNEGNTRHHWLKVRVLGSRSNRSGFGVRVEIEAAGGLQVQEIGSQPSYLSQNALEAHFGLGRASEVGRISVRFPSGRLREFTRVAPNQTIFVEEGSR
jgi:hypothetical protein